MKSVFFLLFQRLQNSKTTKFVKGTYIEARPLAYVFLFFNGTVLCSFSYPLQKYTVYCFDNNPKKSQMNLPSWRTLFMNFANCYTSLFFFFSRRFFGIYLSFGWQTVRGSVSEFGRFHSEWVSS